MDTFLIADTHFNHARVIDFSSRPFTSVEDMNLQLINNWNSDVRSKDLIYVLGDFGFGSAHSLLRIMSHLNGKKILIMGNHDRRKTVGWWQSLGFKEAHKNPLKIGNCILSHEPQDVDFDELNYHGHIHGTLLDQNKFDPSTHVCVSVECTDYRPIKIELRKDVIEWKK